MISSEIIELYKSRLISVKEISQLVSKSESTIRRYLKKNNIFYNYENPEWLKTQYINNNLSVPNIAKLANCDISTIHSRLEKYNVKKISTTICNKKYHYDNNFFKEIDSEEKAYWLGFLYADGNISYRSGQYRVKLELASKDKEHLVKFKKSLSNDGIIKDKRTYDERTKHFYYGSVIKIYNKEMCNDLISLGYVVGKNYLNTVPDIPEELVRHFIRGLIDGDGCFYTYKQYRMINASVTLVGGKNVIDFVVSHIKSKFNISISEKYERKMHFCIMRGNIQVLKIVRYLYDDCNIYLTRKFNKVQDWIKHYQPIHDRRYSLNILGKPGEVGRNDLSPM